MQYIHAAPCPPRAVPPAPRSSAGRARARAGLGPPARPRCPAGAAPSWSSPRAPPSRAAAARTPRASRVASGRAPAPRP
eukprot:scaffold20784_cov63-Phaeocystis_antarctica.AAC.1